MKTPSLAAALLVALAAAPIAFAQTSADSTETAVPQKPKPKPKPKRKGAKPVPAVSASAAPEPPPPPPAPPPPPEESAAPAQPPPPAPAPASEWNVQDTTEEPLQRYNFVGLRYRGDIIPQAITSLFVARGATLYSNALGVELDSRKDGFSTVFALTYQNYDTGDILFLQKNVSTEPSNFSVIHSGLSATYASVDLLWSTPVANHVDFEYGLGVGLGVVFGSLHEDWVYSSANGPYHDASTGQTFAKCQTVNDGPSCQPSAHTQPTDTKVGNYTLPHGIGGPVPILFPMVNVPQVGLRYKPTKQFEARLGLGFSLTGFWFGISGDYGLEQPKESTSKKAAGPVRGGLL